MSILVEKNTRVVVQGITGKEGTFHTKQMIAYGTAIVAGVTPGAHGGRRGGGGVEQHTVQAGQGARSVGSAPAALEAHRHVDLRPKHQLTPGRVVRDRADFQKRQAVAAHDAQLGHLGPVGG